MSDSDHLLTIWQADSRIRELEAENELLRHQIGELTLMLTMANDHYDQVSKLYKQVLEERYERPKTD